MAEKNKGVLAAKTPCMEAWTETEHLTGKYIDALKQGRLNPDAPPLGMPKVVLNVLETNYTNSMTVLINLRKKLKTKFDLLDQSVEDAMAKIKSSAEMVKYAIEHPEEVPSSPEVPDSDNEKDDEDAELFPVTYTAKDLAGDTVHTRKEKPKEGKTPAASQTNSLPPPTNPARTDADKVRAEKEAAMIDIGYTKEFLEGFTNKELDEILEASNELAKKNFLEAHKEQVRAEYDAEKKQKQQQEAEKIRLEAEKQKAAAEEKEKRKAELLQAAAAKRAEELKKQEKKRLQIEDMKATLATKPLDEKAAAAAAAELKESLAKGR